MEACQVMFQPGDRVFSMGDIAANTAGAVVGALMWSRLIAGNKKGISRRGAETAETDCCADKSGSRFVRKEKAAR